MNDTNREKIRYMQLKFGTIEILQALKWGIDQDLSDSEEEMKDPNPNLRPGPETIKDLEVYEMELQGVIERLDAAERLHSN
jgi:hypothetical protein